MEMWKKTIISILQNNIWPYKTYKANTCTWMFAPGKNNQFEGSTGSKLSTKRVGAWAVLITNTLSMAQQLPYGPSVNLSSFEVTVSDTLASFSPSSDPVSKEFKVVVTGVEGRCCDHLTQTSCCAAVWGMWTRCVSVPSPNGGLQNSRNA